MQNKIDKIFQMRDQITYDIYVYNQVSEIPFQAKPERKIKAEYLELPYIAAKGIVEELERNDNDYEVM